MKNDPAALAVACVTTVFETRASGASLVEQAVALQEVTKDLSRGELAGVVATMAAWLVMEMPQDPEVVRRQLRSMGLSLGGSVDG